MREIKFRGRKIRTGDFVYGDLLHKGSRVYIAVNHHTKIRVKPCTVAQFIGCDSNGTELYEDDTANVIAPDERILLPIVCSLKPTLVDLFLSSSGYKVIKEG